MTRTERAPARRVGRERRRHPAARARVRRDHADRWTHRRYRVDAVLSGAGWQTDERAHSSGTTHLDQRQAAVDMVPT